MKNLDCHNEVLVLEHLQYCMHILNGYCGSSDVNKNADDTKLQIIELL